MRSGGRKARVCLERSRLITPGPIHAVRPTTSTEWIRFIFVSTITRAGSSGVAPPASPVPRSPRHDGHVVHPCHPDAPGDLSRRLGKHHGRRRASMKPGVLGEQEQLEWMSLQPVRPNDRLEIRRKAHAAEVNASGERTPYDPRATIRPRRRGA